MNYYLKGLLHLGIDSLYTVVDFTVQYSIYSILSFRCKLYPIIIYVNIHTACIFQVRKKKIPQQEFIQLRDVWTAIH